MNKELNNFYKNYVKNNEVNIRPFCDKNEAFKIIKVLFEAVPFDCPDFYFIEDKNCYIFEHFQVDASYRSKRKGSQYLQNRSKADREIDLETKNMIENSKHPVTEITTVGTVSKTVIQNANIKNLETNFNNLFDKHYQQIENYKNHLRRESILTNEKIKTIFIIEHTTELGGFYLKNGKYSPFEIQFADFVIKKLECSSNIDYVIFLDRNESSRTFVVLKNNDLKNIKNYLIDTTLNHIFFFSSITDICSTIFVPKSALKDNSEKNISKITWYLTIFYQNML